MAKFERRINYLRANSLWKGAEKLQILPVFYTPYAPYPKLGDITLVSSILGLIWLVGSKFGFRKFEYVEANPRLKEFLEKDNGDRLFPLDLSEEFSDLPPDTYRIDDGIVDEIDAEYSEANVNVLLPSGFVAPVPFDVSKETQAKLEAEGAKGAVVRMLLYNLTGGWALTQLVDFKILKKAEEIKGLDFETAIRMANPNGSVEDFVLKTWGGAEGRYLLNFASKWQIDLDRLFSKLKSEGQNLYTGIAAAEALEVPGHIVMQCECGDTFSVDGAYIERLRSMTTSGIIKCEGCDPETAKRLEIVTGGKLYRLSASDLLRFFLSVRSSAPEK